MAEKSARTKKASRRIGKGQADAAPGIETLHAGQKPFPIVALGASAGGLEAFEQFFKKLPSRPTRLSS